MSEARNTFYVPIFLHRILDEGKFDLLTASAQRALLGLLIHVDSKGKCYPGRARLCRLLKMSARALRSGIEKLEAEGIISIERRSGKISIYQFSMINDYKKTEAQLAPGDNCTGVQAAPGNDQTGAQTCQGVGYKATPHRGTNVPPNSYLNSSINSCMHEAPLNCGELGEEKEQERNTDPLHQLPTGSNLTPEEIVTRELGLHGIAGPNVERLTKALLWLGNWKAAIDCIRQAAKASEKATNPSGLIVTKIDIDGEAQMKRLMREQKREREKVQKLRSPETKSITLDEMKELRKGSQLEKMLGDES